MGHWSEISWLYHFDLWCLRPVLGIVVIPGRHSVWPSDIPLAIPEFTDSVPPWHRLHIFDYISWHFLSPKNTRKSQYECNAQCGRFKKKWKYMFWDLLSGKKAWLESYDKQGSFNITAYIIAMFVVVLALNQIVFTQSNILWCNEFNRITYCVCKILSDGHDLE